MLHLGLVQNNILYMYKIILFFVVIFLSSCNRTVQNNALLNDGFKNTHHYTTGQLKDSTYDLGHHDFKFMSYYETGELCEVGYKRDSLKNGSWRRYDKLGRITNVESYYKDEPLAIKPDSSDFYFRNYEVDSAMSLDIPKNWLTEKVKGSELVLYKEHCTEPFRPNVVIIKGAVNNLPTQGINNDSVVDFVVSLLNRKYNSVKILHYEWKTPKLLMVYYVAHINDQDIYHLDSILIGDKNFYYLIAGCYYGQNSEFLKYLDIFSEMIYSIRLNNNNVI